eukprot:scaffold87484_cov20-Tisochrysis_lutea.AAC.2
MGDYALDGGYGRNGRRSWAIVGAIMDPNFLSDCYCVKCNVLQERAMLFQGVGGGGAAYEGFLSLFAKWQHARTVFSSQHLCGSIGEPLHSRLRYCGGCVEWWVLCALRDALSDVQTAAHLSLAQSMLLFSPLCMSIDAHTQLN